MTSSIFTMIDSVFSIITVISLLLIISVTNLYSCLSVGGIPVPEIQYIVV